MGDGICPFAELLRGASWDDNNKRRQAVRAVTIHTTEGRNSVGLGQGRIHDTPGTFNFLTGAAGELWQFYPADVRCTHAAGGNEAGPGVENEGFTGQDFPDAQLAILGRLAHWLNGEYGVPLVYKSGDPRIWVDESDYAGFVAHRAIAYPPNTSYQHFDLITDEEWARAIGAVPAPPAALIEEDDAMSETLVNWTADQAGTGEWHYAVVNESGDVFHHFGPGGANREFLCGPSGATFSKPVTPPVRKVTKQVGVTGVKTRLDLFVEFDKSQGHLWRATNTDPWHYEPVN